MFVLIFVKLKIGSHRYLIGGLYRPPSGVIYIAFFEDELNRTFHFLNSKFEEHNFIMQGLYLIFSASEFQ